MLLATALFLSLLGLEPQPRITLSTELQKHGVVPTGRLDDWIARSPLRRGERRDMVAIAYYWHTGSICSRACASGHSTQDDTWRSALLDTEKLKGGAALRIARRMGLFTRPAHQTIRGRLVVLSEDLEVQRSLYGWSSLILETVAFCMSTAWFTSRRLIRLGERLRSRSDRDIRVYPATPIRRPAMSSWTAASARRGRRPDTNPHRYHRTRVGVGTQQSETTPSRRCRPPGHRHLRPLQACPVCTVQPKKRAARTELATLRPVGAARERPFAYANAPPTMILRIRSHGDPCEMLLVCVG